MARILVLARSGFGKTFSLAPNKELGHIGLNPKETYIISVTSKPLSFAGSATNYKVAPVGNVAGGNRYITNEAETIAELLTMLSKSNFKNVVIDDFNYIMQDFYMKNALKNGWDTPKQIGFKINLIFEAMELYKDSGKNLIVLAHGENTIDSDNRIYTKMKTTGKMVDEYVTPEGKFDITLIGSSKFDSLSKKVVKEFITSEDELNSSPKSPYGMFEETHIKNDMGLVTKAAEIYYKKEQAV